MKLIKQTGRGVLSVLLVAVFMLSLCAFPLSATTDTEDHNFSMSSSSSSGSDKAPEDETVDTPEPEEPSRIHAGYAFSDKDSITEDVGGKFPLNTKTFGASALSSVAGYRDQGMSGYVTLDSALFSSLDQVTMGFWARFSADTAKSKSTLFRVGGKNRETIELSFSVEGKNIMLRLSVEDGKRAAFCSYDVTEILGAEEAWHHIAFAYKKAGNASLLHLFVNGKLSTSSVTTSFIDLSSLKANSVAIQGVTVDELYVTNFALETAKISSMMNQSVESFYALEQKEIDGLHQESPGPLEPVTPIEPYVYNWAAYLFEGSYNAEGDYNNGAVSATLSPDCGRISSSGFKSKFGYGIIRNENAAPAQYLKIQEKLVYGQNSFSFAAWVYRNGKAAPNEECLLFLDGRGTLRFAPYAIGADGKPSAYLEYTDSRGKIQHSTIGAEALASPVGKWVHFALTYAYDGTILVYVNAELVASFSSGVGPAALAYSDCRVVTGASSSDTAYTVVDEVYFAPKVLPAAEIRKIHYYGLAQYTSRALPDPGQLPSGDTPGSEENPFTPDDTDFAEDAFTKVGMIQNGFVGTSFDDRAALGRDWNEGAEATITGDRLTNGVSSYGLSLDGSTSFLRYPIGILDGMQELTISLSYNWAGPTSDTQRSQRLFDFSRKASSVSNPTAFIYLETGNGFSGLKFCISDGISMTSLPYDYNGTDTWVRITVTVEMGLITLYLDDKAVASMPTTVDLASICPNFCYVGRSGVKGDPLFKGSVDEIYISNQAMAAEEVGRWVNGISAAMSDSPADTGDSLDSFIKIAVILAILLIIFVIVLITVRIAKRARAPKAEIPPPPPLRPGEVSAGPVLGPRSARRARMEGIDLGTTVKFRRVQENEDVSAPDPQATATFRKVDVGESSAATGETAVFRKVDSDSSDSH